MSDPMDLPQSAPPSGGDSDVEFLCRIVNRLVVQRKALGISLRQLSEATGYDFSYLSKAERGLAQPGLIPLRKWSHALGFPFSRLIASESADEEDFVQSIEKPS